MARSGVDKMLSREIAAKLNDAPYGRRGDVVASYCAALGWSAAKLYAVASEAGYSSSRRMRRDKGAAKAVTETDVRKVSAVIERTRRKTGKVNMPTWGAMLHMTDNGLIDPASAPSDSTVNRHMRRLRISRADLGRPEPTIEMASLHPNHVHQIDASVCVMWDFKDKKHLVTRDMQTAFYKNKPGFWREVKKVILRYICVDHTTGWFYVRYYYSRGEDFANLFDFTMRAWGVKDDPRVFPAHGMSRILMIDKGAANISEGYTSLMKNLQVEIYVHTPGRPWINGAVEAAHGFWERAFEGDLSLLRIADPDELNARAFDKAAYINAMRRHKRTRTTRFEGFSRITKEQLLILPPREVCEKFCHTYAESATVNGKNQLRYEGRRYDLASTYRRGDKLWVRFNRFDYPAVEINEKEDFSGDWVASAVINETEWGYSRTAPVIGEQFRALKQDATTRFKGKLKDIDISDVVPQLQAPKLDGLTWMPKKGTEMQPAAPVIVPPMTSHEARKKLREESGMERFSTAQSEWIDARIGESVSDEEYARVKEEFEEMQHGAWSTEEEAAKPGRRLGLA